MNVKYPYLSLGLSPAVVVHSLADGCAAAAAGMAVTLLSAEGAALFAGAAWWGQLAAGARAAFPGTPIQDVLDCADAPGLALEALRGGQKLIRLAQGPAWALVAARAAACDAAVLAARPPALDLARRVSRAALMAWLAGDGG